MGKLTLFPYNSCILVQLDILATIPSLAYVALVFTVCKPSWVNSPYFYLYNSRILVQLDILATILSFSRCSPNLYCLQTIMGQLILFPYNSWILVQLDILTNIPRFIPRSVCENYGAPFGLSVIA